MVRGLGGNLHEEDEVGRKDEWENMVPGAFCDAVDV